MSTTLHLVSGLLILSKNDFSASTLKIVLILDNYLTKKQLPTSNCYYKTHGSKPIAHY